MRIKSLWQENPGTMPSLLKGYELVDIILRDGTEASYCRCSMYDWERDPEKPNGGDIMMWRIS